MSANDGGRKMTRSPNDVDPPDMERPLEEFYNLIYEKYHWVEDLVDSDYEAWPYEEIQKNFEGLLKFVIDLAYASGRDDANTTMGLFIDLLHTKQFLLEKELANAVQQHDG
jgi:hypothetical protein